jgi:hypothetical protein
MSTNHEVTPYVIFQSPVTSTLFRPNVFLDTLFSNTLSLCSSVNVRGRASHPYKTGKITALYSFVFMFLDVNLEEE